MQAKKRALETLSTLSQMTGTKHVLLEDTKEVGGGPVLHGLDLDGKIFLVYEDEDYNQRVVAPIEWWDQENLLEAVDDPLKIISLGDLSCQKLAATLTSENGQIR